MCQLTRVKKPGLTLLRSILPFSHGPTLSGLNPGLVLPFHMAANHCVRVELIVLKMAFLVWVYRLIALLSYHVAAKKACGTSALTSDYGHGLGSA